MTADSGEFAGLSASTYPFPYTAPDMHPAVKLQYSVNNPGKVGSTAVYLSSWIRVNYVLKVANATLQYLHV